MKPHNIHTIIKTIQSLLTLANKALPLYEKAKPLLQNIKLPSPREKNSFTQITEKEMPEENKKRTSSLTFFQ